MARCADLPILPTEVERIFLEVPRETSPQWTVAEIIVSAKAATANMEILAVY
jgi:hypothetical protein